MSNNAHELSNRLLNALDNNYNVVDMHAVNEIISVLERFNITKELLETTRLGKHVNELRRKTTEPTLARRAKVLVKRWRDLVIPTNTSPGHTGSNRSSAERQVRRLAGTPLTSPALSRQVVSPAVPSPRTAARPAWGGYESDSQDVILVDDDPPPPPTVPLTPATAPSVKRPPSPQPLHDEKKAKRDKKPKKRRGHSRAGSGTEAGGGAPEGGAGGPRAGGGLAGPRAGGGPWAGLNGAAHAERRNGCRRDALEPYAALVNKLPPLGSKKVKTTQELLAQIQSRGSAPPRSPPPASPSSPDVMLIEPDPGPVTVQSPLRNGGGSPRVPPLSPPRSPTPPLEEERPYPACSCGAEPDEGCPARARRRLQGWHVRALHNALLPGINGTRAPALPHPHPARTAPHPHVEGLFASVVPLYRYTDYADDYCAKNMTQVPLSVDLPWLIPDEAPAEVKPSPEGDGEEVKMEIEESGAGIKVETEGGEAGIKVEAEAAPEDKPEAPTEGGRALVELCARCSNNVPYSYSMLAPAPVLALPADEADLQAALEEAAGQNAPDRPRDEPARPRDEPARPRDALGRPPRPARFAEWHEAARLPRDVLALPYVVLD